jgi:hypothetical protein
MSESECAGETCSLSVPLDNLFKCDLSITNNSKVTPFHRVLAQLYDAIHKLPTKEETRLCGRLKRMVQVFPDPDVSGYDEQLKWVQLAGIEFGLWIMTSLYYAISNTVIPVGLFCLYNGAVVPGKSKHGSLLYSAGLDVQLTTMNNCNSGTAGLAGRRTVSKLVTKVYNKVFHQR